MSCVEVRTNTFTRHVSRLHACVTHPSTPSAKREDCDAILPSPFIHQNASTRSSIAHEKPPAAHARWIRKISRASACLLCDLFSVPCKRNYAPKMKMLGDSHAHPHICPSQNQILGKTTRFSRGPAYKATRALRLFFSVQFFVFFFPRVSRLRRWDLTLNASHSE